MWETIKWTNVHIVEVPEEKREKEERMTKISSDLIRDVVAHTVKNLPAVRETWVQSLVRKIP